MTRPGIEPWSPRLLVYTLTTYPIILETIQMFHAWSVFNGNSTFVGYLMPNFVIYMICK